MADIKQTLSRSNPAQLIALATAQAALMAPAAPATPPIPNMAARITALLAKRGPAQTASAAYDTAKAQLASLLTARNSAADALRDELNLVAKAAATESGGDAAQLQAAGYQLASTTSAPSATTGQVLNLVLTAGDAEKTVDAACDPEPTAKTYEWQVATADPVTGPYTTVAQTTASSAMLDGLTSGSRIWVRVRAVGVKGPGPWSDPATKIVP